MTVTKKWCFGNLKNQNVGSNMADENAKGYLILIMFVTREFLESLITNVSLKFINSKWRIQYAGRKCKKLLDWDKIWYSGIIAVADYESGLNIQKLYMADLI